MQQKKQKYEQILDALHALKEKVKAGKQGHKYARELKSFSANPARRMSEKLFSHMNTRTDKSAHQEDTHAHKESKKCNSAEKVFPHVGMHIEPKNFFIKMQRKNTKNHD